jgi:CBS domain-containing protein
MSPWHCGKPLQNHAIITKCKSKSAISKENMKDDIAHFLHNHLPFSLLPADQMQPILDEIVTGHIPAGDDILVGGGSVSTYLYVVRHGSVEMLREDGQDVTFSDILHEGEIFGILSLLRGKPPEVTVRSREETQLYLIPAHVFHQLRCAHLDFARFVDNIAFDRLLLVNQRQIAGEDPEYRVHLRDILQRNLVCVDPELSVRDAARLMKQNDVRYIIVESDPYGIVTDHDLRNVLIDGLPYDTPVKTIMTAPLRTLPADSLVFEGLILLLENHFRHLPVTEDGRIVGVITHTDILRQLSHNPLFLPRQLMRSRTVDDYRRYTDQVTKAVGSLLTAGARVHDIGRMVAVSHSAMLKRMLRQAEMELGPPPCRYAWLVLGSEGRFEQTLRTDQDNALVYADEASPAAVAYFVTLAKRIVDQLVASGFPLCPGDIMATNAKWCQPAHVWQTYFQDWIHLPDEEALMRASIFFDYRQIYGKLNIEELLRPIIREAGKNGNFLRRLAKNTLRQTPPLGGWFRDFAVDHDTAGRAVINLKERGTALIVDLARLYAIEAGCAATNTMARLHLSVPRSSLSEKGGKQLEDAFEHISLLRLRHQYALMERGEEPNNMVPVSQLSAIERRDLKDAFRAIESVQQGVAATFGTSWVM